MLTGHVESTCHFDATRPNFVRPNVRDEVSERHRMSLRTCISGMQGSLGNRAARAMHPPVVRGVRGALSQAVSCGLGSLPWSCASKSRWERLAARGMLHPAVLCWFRVGADGGCLCSSAVLSSAVLSGDSSGDSSGVITSESRCIAALQSASRCGDHLA